MTETELKIKRFSDQMLIEMKHNEHKGNMFDWDDFEKMITELEYHKAKMFMAIRVKNQDAIKEYIADTANLLMAIGNFFSCYEEESDDYLVAWELNKNSHFLKRVPLEDISKNQNLI